MITNDIKAKDKSSKNSEVKAAKTADKKEVISKENEAVKKNV
jgi:hypothetical protein